MIIDDSTSISHSSETTQSICYAPVRRGGVGGRTTTHGSVYYPVLELDRDVLPELFNGNGTLVNLSGALPVPYCVKLVDAASQVPFQAYAKTENSTQYQPILKFGPTMFDHIGTEDKSEYFREAREATTRGAAAFADVGVCNPLTVALNALRNAWPERVEVAREPQGPEYFAGVMRDIPSGALPHVDDAAVETPEMAVGDIIAQASLVFYVSAPTAGGALRVYDKRPTEQDRRDHVLGYGFTADAVHNATFRGIIPGVGTVALFPTTQIHSVDPVTGDGRRITWSTFIGLRADGSLILWS